MRFFILIKCVCLSWMIQTIACAEAIQLAYSDLVPDKFARIIDDFQLSTEQQIRSTQTGSLPMIEEFLAGRYDICLLAMPEGSELPILNDSEITQLPLAYQSAVVIVNADNPISELTFSQLAAIFGTASSGLDIKSWRDLGMAAFSTSSIKSYAAKDLQSITSDLFRFTLFNSLPFKSAVQVSTPKKIERLVSQDKVAIGIIPHLPQRENVKALFIAKDTGSIAYGPNSDNLYFADYSIRLPFYIVFRERDTQRLLPILNHLLGDSISEFLEESHFFPVPKMIRDKYAIDLQLFIQENEN